MKLVTAIIQPFMLDRLARALRQAPIAGYTIVAARGFGRDADGDLELHHDRVRLETAVSDDVVQAIVSLITETVSTQQGGDGIVFVSDLVHVVDIKSGKTNDEALAASHLDV